MQVAHKFKVRSLIYCSICGMQNIFSIVFPDVILILVIKREQRKGKVVNYGSKVDLAHHHKAIRSEQKRVCNFT